jgi:hypothetical protein
MVMLQSLQQPTYVFLIGGQGFGRLQSYKEKFKKKG